MCSSTAQPANALSRPPTSTARRLRIIYCRKWQAFAGFALAATFFMPVVDGCNSPVYPCQIAYSILSELDSDAFTNADEILVLVPASLSAYLFGVMVGVSLMRRWRAEDRVETRHPKMIGVLIGLTGFAILAGFGIWYVREPSGARLGPPEVGLLSIIAGSFVYTIRCLRNRTGGALCLRWYGAACCIAWFVWLAWDGSPRWGLYVSVGAALLLLISATLEAKLSGVAGWRAAIVDLALGQVNPLPADEHFCHKCGYNLFGLDTPRCPECGASFEETSFAVLACAAPQNFVANSTTTD